MHVKCCDYSTVQVPTWRYTHENTAEQSLSGTGATLSLNKLTNKHFSFSPRPCVDGTSRAHFPTVQQILMSHTRYRLACESQSSCITNGYLGSSIKIKYLDITVVRLTTCCKAAAPGAAAVTAPAPAATGLAVPTGLRSQSYFCFKYLYSHSL